MAYAVTAADAEATAVGVSNIVRPKSWSQLVPSSDIRCGFYKAQVTASPTSSDSEATKFALRPALFRPTQRNVIIGAKLMNDFLSSVIGANSASSAFALAGGVAVKVLGIADRITFDVDICLKGDINPVLRALLRYDRYDGPCTHSEA